MPLSSRIVSATAQLAISNLAIRSLAILTLPVLTRIFSPTAYGTAALSTTLISLFSVTILAGMDMSYVRTCSSQTHDATSPMEIFAWKFVLTGGLVAGLSIPLLSLCEIPFSPINRYAFFLVGLGVFVTMVCTMAQARARLQSKYRSMAATNIVAGIASICVPLAGGIWWRNDEIPLIFAVIAANLIPVAILGIPPPRRLCAPTNLTLSTRLDLIKIGLAGIVTAPAYWVLIYSDRWVLGFFADTAAVGVYGMGCAVGSIGLMLNNAAMTVWTPETTREFEKDPAGAPVRLGRVAEKLIVSFACVWLAVTAAGGDLVRLLAAPAFHEAANVVPYISGGVFFYGLYHLSNATLLYAKRLNYSMWWWLTGALFSLVTNILLVPSYGIVGAGIAQAASFLLIAIGVITGAQRYLPLRVRWRRLLVAGILIVLTGIWMTPAWFATPEFSLLYKFPVGVLVTILTFVFVDQQLFKLRLRQNGPNTRKIR